MRKSKDKKETSFSGRAVKKAIEDMIAKGMEKAAVVKQVVDMGIETSVAEFMVGLYARKFNQ